MPPSGIIDQNGLCDVDMENVYDNLVLKGYYEQPLLSLNLDNITDVTELFQNSNDIDMEEDELNNEQSTNDNEPEQSSSRQNDSSEISEEQTNQNSTLKAFENPGDQAEAIMLIISNGYANDAEEAQEQLSKYLNNNPYATVADLQEALEEGFNESENDDNNVEC